MCIEASFSSLHFEVRQLFVDLYPLFWIFGRYIPFFERCHEEKKVSGGGRNLSKEWNKRKNFWKLREIPSVFDTPLHVSLIFLLLFYFLRCSFLLFFLWNFKLEQVPKMQGQEIDDGFRSLSVVSFLPLPKKRERKKGKKESRREK